MRRLACLLVLFSSFPLSAQEASFIAPLAKSSVLLDAKVGDYLVVVGERGHVLLSEDGEVFEQVQVPTQSTLTAVSMIGDNIWAAGHDAVILYSGDRGATWTVQNYEPELERPFLDLHFFDVNEGIAIGAYGLFYRTVDGGLTWQPERHAELLDPMDQEYLNEIRQESEEFYLQELDSILPHLNRVSESGDALFMAGETGLLASSSDRGKSWQRLSANYAGSFFDIKAVDQQGTLLAVGLRGNAFVSESGETWTKVQTCTTATLNSLYHHEDNTWIAVGNNGVITRLQLPLQQALDAPASQCDSLSEVTTTQTADKSAIVNLVSVRDQVFAVSAQGIQLLDLK
ncbi:hypothetical protein DRW07_07360 [Alteromonas sediminis]|uniref:Photosynthesis system II assembly factor Ycf48/Hcf136-like domain-containing protein n=2 Tax=Alteromonas sediminis TaxID=2259342 RepID=A0A3N5YP97_9ALTE|nr:hypothetical protein DRW07_07360 [Alteromonas sediminis]